MAYKSDLNKADRISESENFPDVLLLDNTNLCNLKCSMCDHVNVSKYRKLQKMDFELYKKIIDEVAVENPDCRVWQIYFGDPFLCSDMDERISYAKEKGLTDVVLNSNGVLMSEQKALSYIEAGLDSIYVGIDAINEETYDKIRIGGDYNTVVENVLNYQKLLRKYGSKNQELFVQFVVSKINEDEVDRFCAFWQNEGVKVKIRPKISWAGIIDAENLHNNADVERKPCFWLMRTMSICADGTVSLCAVDLHNQVKCGNVNKNSVKEIWKNGILSQYRKMHKELQFSELPILCRDCRDWQSAYSEYK